MSTRPKRPNILWICSDSQRWDTLGCLGNPWVRTPVLDRLAAGGAMFTHAFTQSPLCTPSRGSFLTGRYPVTNRLRQNGQLCPDDLRLVTRIVADAGWVCGLSGKLHLSNCDQRLTLGPDWWKEDPKRWRISGIERRIHDGYQEFYWDHSSSGSDPASAYTAWLHERGGTVVKQAHPDCPALGIGMPSDLHQSRFCADMAISFSERHRDQPYPWLFSVNCFDPHYPFDPPADMLARYLDHIDELPDVDDVAGELENKPTAQRHHRDKMGIYSQLDAHQRRLVKAGYWAMCDHVDQQVGRILDALERSGQRDNTIVIYQSDHGELLGDHGVWIKDQFFYDPCIRVPLIISWPGRIAAGQVVSDLVEFTDLAPTLLDALGLPAEPGMQGRSWWSRVTGGTYHTRDDVYCEFLGANPKRNGTSRFASMIRTATRKLVSVHGIDEGEFYDLQTDPGEHRNLWRDPTRLGEKVDLLKRLSDRQAFTADPLPPRVGVY